MGVFISSVVLVFEFFVPEGKRGGGLRGVGTLMKKDKSIFKLGEEDDGLIDDPIVAVVCVLCMSVLLHPGSSFECRDVPIRFNCGRV
jgi:hypothetical protein